jgi:signal transduction histidine kinase/ligand-binding sensor domain-containing protein
LKINQLKVNQLKIIILSLIKYFLLLFLLINSNGLLAQTYSKTKTFTTNDGLPSDHVYDAVEDAKGFLWIATDNGVARFDGKYFKNFTLRNGLPSNDVLQVLEDKDGTIWVNCYKKAPAYFDLDKNKFITLDNAITRNYCMNFFHYFKSKDGKVAFYSGNNYFELYRGTVTKQSSFGAILLNNNSFQETIFFNSKTKLSTRELFLTNKAHQKKLILKRENLDIIKIPDEQSLVFLDKKSYYKISNINAEKLSFQLDSIKPPKEIKWFKISGNKLALNFADNTVTLYNKKTLKLIANIDNKVDLNLTYFDKNNRAWFCTLNDGLQLYQKNNIKNNSYLHQTQNKNLLSCEITPNGTIYAGNDAGELFITKDNKTIKRKISSQSPVIWLRKIICLKDKTIVINDLGISINLKPSVVLLQKDKRVASLKTAVKVNDSIVLVGTNIGLLKYNLNTLKYVFSDSPNIRISNIIKASDNIFYFIGGNDLYQYDYVKGFSTKIILNKNTSQDAPTFLGYDQRNTLYVSTVSGNILMLKNNKVIKKINNTIGLPENITCLLPLQNKLWIGSKSGIYVLDLTTSSFDKLSTIDGLSTNFINDLAFANDTVYAASAKGLIKINSKTIFPKFDIVPQVVSLRINNNQTKIANTFDLKSNQNDIFLRFAAVELTGHFRKFQYAINNTTQWNELTENTLNLQLNCGVTSLYVRAINSNNKIGTKTLALKFDIDIPFYKAIWFWLLILFLFLLFSFWINYQNSKAKLKRKLVGLQQLEQQRNKITADLHDDIGSTLSSLQLNSAIAQQLIRKDLPQAEKLLTKIENQSKDLADKIGDIIWSMKPGKNEFMTMSSRIKNFANDILSSTNINYKIKIDKNIDENIKDITTRKNIVLFIKEATNNAAKYSQATYFEIKIEMTDNIIQIEIQDNGIGFAISETNGNGIGNMKRRIEELKGVFIIISDSRRGTIIKATIPVIT